MRASWEILFFRLPTVGRWRWDVEFCTRFVGVDVLDDPLRAIITNVTASAAPLSAEGLTNIFPKTNSHKKLLSR